MAEQKPMQNAFVRAAVVAAGVFYTLAGAALLFAPQWFYDNIGTYPPFNRHYEGDLGAILFPLGLVLLWAARHPERHVALLAFTTFGSAIHAANHLYDDVIGQVGLQAMLSSTGPLILFALVLALATFWAGQQRTPAAVNKSIGQGGASPPDRVATSR